MFEVGHVYRRRQDIHGRFNGQRQGGISTPSEHPLIFIFTGEAGEQYGYRDEFRPDGTFWYTGEGRSGDMVMQKGNRAIRDHAENGKALHLFEYVGRGLVRYMGEARYLSHHVEERPDKDGDLRKAIIFELDVEPGTVEPQGDAPAPEAIAESALWSRPLPEVRDLALKPPKTTATKVERRIITRNRSQAVRVYVLRRAGGVCEACGREAPFKTKRGRPYLEPHHIQRVADGGPDDPRWVAGICPNCHREIHHGVRGEQLNSSLAEMVGRSERQH
jgi:5-methylcytosine-specific restriction protein A